jgi:T5SS/PEP-CTERM-associated repeat protein
VTTESEVYSAGELFVGTGAGSFGQVFVTGPGAHLQSDSSYASSIGGLGEGTLSIENGGRVQVRNMVIGESSRATGPGTVRVRGAQSVLSVAGFLGVGLLHEAILDAGDEMTGGQVRIGDALNDEVPPGVVSISEHGVLAGHGPIVGDVVVHGGNVEPGASMGTLMINGDYRQGAGGTLVIELGGTLQGSDYDDLVIDGAASLAGTLEIRLMNEFNPTNGMRFRILNAARVTGRFNPVIPPIMRPGARCQPFRAFDVTYDETSVTIIVGPAPRL